MNLPSGKVVKSNLDATATDLIGMLEELRRKRFCGYMALSIKGQGGIEEGTLLIDGGKVVGCTYDYYAYDVEMAGEKAFQRILNASTCKNGVLDVVELSAEQVHLALAFHEEAVFVPTDDSLRHLKLPPYSPFYEDEVRKVAQSAPASMDANRKYKLQGLGKTPGETRLPEAHGP